MLNLESAVAPPPGFGPKEVHNESSSSGYSLWGNSTSSGTSSLQGLFQQNSGIVLLHYSGTCI